MSPALKALGVERMTTDERIALVTEIWDSIASDPGAGLLTEEQRAELRRRVVDAEANPDDMVSWEEAKAAALKRIGK